MSETPNGGQNSPESRPGIRQWIETGDNATPGVASERFLPIEGTERAREILAEALTRLAEDGR